LLEPDAGDCDVGSSERHAKLWIERGDFGNRSSWSESCLVLHIHRCYDKSLWLIVTGLFVCFLECCGAWVTDQLTDWFCSDTLNASRNFGNEQVKELSLWLSEMVHINMSSNGSWI
jgi:hypothetical protein